MGQISELVFLLKLAGNVFADTDKINDLILFIANRGERFFFLENFTTTGLVDDYFLSTLSTNQSLPNTLKKRLVVFT